MENPFSFPLTPYNIQKDFMESLYSTLSEKKFGIFESPTGTGKTLSIICSAFTWLEENYAAKETVEVSDSQSWINDISETELDQKLLKSSVDDSLYDKRSNSPLIQLEEEKETLVASRDHPSILYISRTHSQLDQFTREIRKTKWFNNQFKLVRLGSRTQLCINPFINSIKNPTLINYRCKELLSSTNKKESCVFYKGHETVRMNLLENMCDIEDLVKLGHKHRGCPYFASRGSLEIADIVVAPYSSILNKRQRINAGLSLNNTIVIVDEAHNLLDAICDSYSCQVSLSHITNAYTSIRKYYDRYYSVIGHKTGMYLRSILEILSKLNEFLAGAESSFSINVSEFLLENELYRIDFGKLLKFINESELVQKINGYALNNIDNFDNMSIHNVTNFIECLSQDTSGGKFVIDTNGSPLIRYLLLDPLNPFKEILNQSRCLILTGGTMEPKEEYMSLISHLDPSEYTLFSCKHVIPDSNLLLASIGKSRDGSDMKFTFENRDSLIHSLVNTIQEISEVVPNGVVVFLPSYKFLEKIQKEFRSHKKVFYDDKSSRLLEVFSEQASTNGAILFAVVRGKLSEGINFSDKLGRCVIVVGMPYPNKSDLEITERMKFLDSMNRSFTGKMYYENSCHKAINQSIGRAIRHQNDYAVVVLIDLRHEFCIRKRPSWMLKYYKKYDTSEVLISDIQEFFRNKT